MTMSDLDRHRAEIGNHYGEARVGALRRIYGTSFALDFDDDATLATIVQNLDDVSLAFLVRDHLAGTLASKVAL